MADKSTDYETAATSSAADNHPGSRTNAFVAQLLSWLDRPSNRQLVRAGRRALRGILPAEDRGNPGCGATGDRMARAKLTKLYAVSNWERVFYIALGAVLASLLLAGCATPKPGIYSQIAIISLPIPEE